jgi:hypothetical protein
MPGDKIYRIFKGPLLSDVKVYFEETGYGFLCKKYHDDSVVDKDTELIPLVLRNGYAYVMEWQEGGEASG